MTHPPVPSTTAPSTSIPFNRPSLVGTELEYVRKAVEQGHTSADGPYSAIAAELLRAETGAAEVLLTTSCTMALEMSAMLLDVGPGDTVVVPSFGFVTTALAFARQGARIHFCDIEPTTLGLDPERVAEVLDPTVRAVVPIHYAGVAADLDGLQKVMAAWPRAELVEDNAHGLFGRLDDRPLGSFGRFATLSFHETKNFTCGEGGALVVNRQEDVERARVIYHKGTDRSAFLLGQVDKYSWQDTGSSCGLSDVLAAYLVAQLERKDWVLGRRRAVFDRYQALLAPHAEELGLQLPTTSSTCCCPTARLGTTCSRGCEPKGSTPPSTTCRSTAHRAVGGCRPGRRRAPSPTTWPAGCSVCPSSPPWPTTTSTGWSPPSSRPPGPSPLAEHTTVPPRRRGPWRAGDPAPRHVDESTSGWTTCGPLLRASRPRVGPARCHRAAWSPRVRSTHTPARRRWRRPG